ncbi:MAG TPA: single-stranded-DNA-specific exonuclease RecJ [Bacteroidota bacterium]|nr:single-stranded-DNA-specific exonuclease RecJ [Bacteroidota bacterium]
MKRDFRWSITPPPDTHLTNKLAKEINVSETITKVLFNRGVTTYSEAKDFFRPQLSNLHDPFLMDGMELAVGRIFKALANNERILIFGDYDVDGTNSAAMLYLYFTELGLNTMFHIPDRITEGYGISITGIEHGKRAGITLLIAVDCGITALSQVEYARSLGIDVIICDHHEPGEEIPNALAVLDPLKQNCHYPFKNLCGCGVGFKFIQAIARRRGDEESVYQYLDFATLATTADIVPLIGENRILTKVGLEHINTKPRAGIKALIENSGVQFGKINTGQIVFVLAPRINAVGRMGDAMRAVRLLTSADETTAMELAKILEEENRKRRKIDEDTFLQAQELVEKEVDHNSKPTIVLHNEHWHPGVIGIVASRLVEKYYRPTIMMTTVDGVAKGSARSIVGFDIYKALKSVEEKVIQFGGHKYAAGLAVALDRIDEFREAFNIAVAGLMTDEIRTPSIKIDTEINLKELTPKFIKVLKEFAPFGPGNMRPIFLARDVEVVGTPKIVGKDHLRFKVRQGSHVLDAIGFGLGSALDELRINGKHVDLVFSVDEHEVPVSIPDSNSGTPSAEIFPQLKIKDIRKSQRGG